MVYKVYVVFSMLACRYVLLRRIERNQIQAMMADIMLPHSEEVPFYGSGRIQNISKKVKRDDKLDRIFLLLNLC